jgi:hypothetical protein
VPLVGVGLALSLFVCGVLPGATLLPAAALLVNDGVPPRAFLLPDWGLAVDSASKSAGAWPATTLAGGAVLVVLGGALVAWRRRRTPPVDAPAPWRLDADALVPLAQAFRLAWLTPASPAARSPGDRVGQGLGRVLRLAGQALFAAEGTFYLPFTVLMLLLVLLALTR